MGPLNLIKPEKGRRVKWPKSIGSNINDVNNVYVYEIYFICRTSSMSLKQRVTYISVQMDEGTFTIKKKREGNKRESNKKITEAVKSHDRPRRKK